MKFTIQLTKRREADGVDQVGEDGQVGIVEQQAEQESAQESDQESERELDRVSEQESDREDELQSDHHGSEAE